MAVLYGCGSGGGSSSSNTSPTISSVSASKTTIYSNGSDSSTITATASDANGDALSYTWSVNGASAGTSTSGTFLFKTTNAGQFTITVTASDGRGGTASSSTIVNSFGATATEGGVTGTLNVPISAYRASAKDATDSGNTLDAPISIGPEPLRAADRSAAATPPAQACEGDSFVPGELLVMLSGGMSAADFAAAHNLSVKRAGASGLSLFKIDVVGLDESAAKTHTRQACRILANAGNTLFVDLNHVREKMSITPNDPQYANQWHYTQLNLPQAWDITTGSSSVVVAVLDTGIVAAHQDLDSKIESGYDFVSDTAAGCDGNGIDNNPEDVADSRCTSGAISLQDPRHAGYHGTHVAGTIAAETHNSLGVAGVSWASKIMPVRVLGAGGGTDYDIQQGMLYAAGIANDSGTTPATPAKIINMSLGGDPGSPCPASYQAIINQVAARNISIFVAAGNESATSLNPLALCSNVFAVGAVGRDSVRAPYSNVGTGLDFVAPGGNQEYAASDGILSTLRNDAANNNTAYGYYQGTSMATPNAAGVAALMVAVNNNITPTQIESIIQQTSTDLGATGYDTSYGYGLMNAYKCVLEAKRLVSTPTEPNQPVIAVSTDKLYFAPSESSKAVVITNTGTGALTLSSVSDSETTGGNWMSTGTTSNTSSITLTVTVNRTGLTAGTTYAGTISIISNGGSISIPVTMDVQTTTVTTPTGCTDTTVWILAVDPTSYDTTGQTSLSAAGGAYVMMEVAAGSHYIVAGTDCNQDDYICDQDTDYCGIYPIESDPQTVTVAGQPFSQSISFPVTQIVAARPIAGASAGLGDRAFKKLKK